MYLKLIAKTISLLGLLISVVCAGFFQIQNEYDKAIYYQLSVIFFYMGLLND